MNPMKKRRDSDDENSTWVKDFFLVLLILAGLGYLAYTHQESIRSFDLKSLNLESLKQLVGLGQPEKASSDTAPPASPNPNPAPVPVPAPMAVLSTNAPGNPVPVVGRPRSILPAKDHWTWVTTDGKTYQDVKVEKIQEGYVTIIYADGGARIPISTLPEEVQRELEYNSAHGQ